MTVSRDSEYAAWADSPQQALEHFRVRPGHGLDDRAVASRVRQWGRNQLAASKPRGLGSILVEQFRSVVVLLLLVAGALALVFGDIAEGMAILAVIFINTAIGFTTEWRAIRSMEALRQYALIECVVLRSGNVRRRPAEDLVPGDIVLLEAGDLVPADLRLFEAAKLSADESTLTGESMPVDKQVAALPAETPMLDRRNMAYKGTVITRGTGRGVVVATGMRTEFGGIFQQVSVAEAQETPLEKRLDALGEGLAWAVMGIAVVIAVAGLVVGRDAYLAIEIAIALAVAAIPEGLPIVATIALARGMWRMARRNALITRLAAVETLGATSMILTDKTGTLTENRMTVTTLLLDEAGIEINRGQHPEEAAFGAPGSEGNAIGDERLDELLTVAVLCNNGSLQRGGEGIEKGVGDPTELALLVAASARDLWREELETRFPEVREDPFDPSSKRMASVHASGDEFLFAVKGAPEAVLELCRTVRTAGGERELDDDGRQAWLGRVERLGEEGLRTLALANKRCGESTADPYADLVLLGVVGMEDPPREGVDTALEACRKAGVEVVMVTGDHASTARNIAGEVGLIADDAREESFVDGRELDGLLSGSGAAEISTARVFSRVAPEQKLALIDFLQRQGRIVAMTGDGVNDAPALKKADIGVAMGIRGTAVAKEAADMVLQDDEFGTIVEAIQHGRVIFENIRKFVVYLLSCNISEVLVVALATIAGAPLPLLPLQILFLNLVTDVFPALALGVGGPSETLMQGRPRSPAEGILLRRHWLQIILYGTLMAATVLGAMAAAHYLLALQRSQAVTVAFLTLAFAQVWHVFNMRASLRHLLRNEITANPWVWAAVVICLVLIFAAVFVPGLAQVLELVDPGARGWLVVALASVVPLLTAPFVRRLAAKLALYREQ